MQDSLQYRYNAIISEYLAQFQEKQGLELDPEDNMQTDFFGFSDGSYIFAIDDIRRDIDQDVPAGVIKEWYSDCSGVMGEYWINYRSWLMGLRKNQTGIKSE